MVYGGQSYLGLRKDLLRRRAVGVGDQVGRTRRMTTSTSGCRTTRATRALGEQPGAAAAYQRLPFTHRNEYARWIDEGKKPETRAERVAKTIKRLTKYG